MVQGPAFSSVTLGVHRRRGVVPTQGEDCDSPPLGWLESNGCCFQNLGRSSMASIHHLLTFSLRDLRGFDRMLMSGCRSRADELGRIRPLPGVIGRKSIIQEQCDTATLLYRYRAHRSISGRFLVRGSGGKQLFGPCQNLTLQGAHPCRDICDPFFDNSRPYSVGY